MPVAEGPRHPYQSPGWAVLAVPRNHRSPAHRVVWYAAPVGVHRSFTAATLPLHGGGPSIRHGLARRPSVPRRGNRDYAAAAAPPPRSEPGSNGHPPGAQRHPPGPSGAATRTGGHVPPGRRAAAPRGLPSQPRHRPGRPCRTAWGRRRARQAARLTPAAANLPCAQATAGRISRLIRIGGEPDDHCLRRSLADRARGHRPDLPSRQEHLGWLVAPRQTPNTIKETLTAAT